MEEDEVRVTQGVTPHRLLDPTSLHLPASRHNDKTVTYRCLRTRRRRGVEEDRRCLSVKARKVEQICNSVSRGDIWNGNTQPLPNAICVSVQGKICQSAAC